MKMMGIVGCTKNIRERERERVWCVSEKNKWVVKGV